MTHRARSLGGWGPTLLLLGYVAVTLIAGGGLLYVAATGAVGQTSELGTENVTVSDSGQQDVLVELEFAADADGTNSTSVTLDYNGTQVDSTSVGVDPGNSTVVALNATDDGDHMVTVTHDGADVAAFDGYVGLQDYGREIEHDTVTLDDPMNESVWADLEFADTADSTNDTEVVLFYSSSEADNETVAVDPGNVTETTLNSSYSGTHDVRVYGEHADVVELTAGSTSENFGGALLSTSFRETIIIAAAGLVSVFLLGALYVGARREGSMNGGRY